ncbi:hypothetical protein FRC19_008786 [Serendipita sp. 401]|nr:hypothetical protein FRC19_008786 [Serendipita sp. 401]
MSQPEQQQEQPAHELVGDGLSSSEAPNEENRDLQDPNHNASRVENDTHSSTPRFSLPTREKLLQAVHKGSGGGAKIPVMPPVKE